MLARTSLGPWVCRWRFWQERRRYAIIRAFVKRSSINRPHLVSLAERSRTSDFVGWQGCVVESVVGRNNVVPHGQKRALVWILAKRHPNWSVNVDSFRLVELRRKALSRQDAASFGIIREVIPQARLCGYVEAACTLDKVPRVFPT
jgi:hypothetical protein